MAEGFWLNSFLLLLNLNLFGLALLFHQTTYQKPSAIAVS